MKVECFGDSLTFGMIGYSYRKFLRVGCPIKNHGINGDTTVHVYERLKRHLECEESPEKDIYILHVGCNDLLLPFLTSISFLWKLQILPRLKMRKCVIEDEKFQQEYEKYFQLFTKYYVKFVIVGIPMCELKGYVNERVQTRNEMILQLAEKYRAPFVDVVRLQKEISPKIETKHSWKHKNLLRMVDAIFMSILPFTKDWFSKIRHLKLTVDGVHYNSLTARRIAEEVQEKVMELI